MPDKAPVVITGASGLTGREIVAAFEDAQSHVVTITRRPIQREDHVSHDLLEPLGEGSLPGRAYGVVHCAAVVDEKRDDFGVVEENLRMTYNIARYARAAQAEWFVYISSIAVYGLAGRGPLDEGTQPSPETPYGLSKLLGEHLCGAILGTAQVSILRLGYVLGHPLPGRYLVRRLADRFATGDPVTVWNADESRLSFVDARDVASTCIRLTRTGENGLFNLVGDEWPTLRELVTALGELQPSAVYVEATVPEEAPMAVQIDNGRAKRARIFTPRPLAESLSWALSPTLP